MAVSSKRPHQQASALETLKKVLTSASGDVSWEKKELLGVIFVVKALAAIIIGFACGVVPVVSLSGFFAYLIGVQAVTFIFYHSILQVDEEEFGGHLELMGEDQNITVPTFLVTWILTFSSVWFN